MKVPVKLGIGMVRSETYFSGIRVYRDFCPRRNGIMPFTWALLDPEVCPAGSEEHLAKENQGLYFAHVEGD
jgi:hypothetical protein